MRIGRSAALAIGIGLLTGCVQMQRDMGVVPSKHYPPNPPPATVCSTATCEVKVTVSVPSQCNMAVDKSRLDISRGPAKMTITWTIDSPAVQWPNPQTDPILPLQFDLNAVGVISNLRVSGNQVSVDYARPSSGGNKYGYGVFVKTGLPTRPVCGIDPWLED